MMQPVAGGAVARPFVTHHNALDVRLYLRIAPELYLKRLVVGGLERVYEINRNFRNEGISTMHNPEFTMLEFYTAWFDCGDVMDTTEALVAARRAGGRRRPLLLRGARGVLRHALRPGDHEGRGGRAPGGRGPRRASRARPWTTRRPSRRCWGPTAFAGLADRLGLDADAYRSLSHGKRVATLFEDLVEASLWDPTFVTDYPVEVSPLAKARPDDPTTTERFELFIAGMEVANGFSELNDPLEQRERFLEQLRERERGDLEAHAMDDDYVRALGHGLPPTGGCGVGIDRLAMILTDSTSIRDVILFPQMRPEGGRDGRGRTDSEADASSPETTEEPTPMKRPLGAPGRGALPHRPAQAGLHLPHLGGGGGRGGGGGDGGAHRPRPHDRPAERDPHPDPGRHRPRQHLPGTRRPLLQLRRGRRDRAHRSRCRRERPGGVRQGAPHHLQQLGGRHRQGHRARSTRPPSPTS